MENFENRTKSWNMNFKYITFKSHRKKSSCNMKLTLKSHKKLWELKKSWNMKMSIKSWNLKMTQKSRNLKITLKSHGMWNLLSKVMKKLWEWKKVMEYENDSKVMKFFENWKKSWNFNFVAPWPKKNQVLTKTCQKKY